MKRTICLILTLLLFLSCSSLLSIISLAAEIPQSSDWSDWSTIKPDEKPGRIIDTKTQYRYQSKEYTSSTSSSLSQYGWECYFTSVSYGSWSSWDDTPVYESDVRDVETRVVYVESAYLMAHYCTGNISGARYQTAPSSNTTNAVFNANCTYHSLGWVSVDDFKKNFYPYETEWLYKGSTTSTCYRCSNTCYRWYKLDTRETAKVQYRYRSKSTTYYYYRWTEWSNWSDTYVSETDTRNVETRILYRYKDESNCDNGHSWNSGVITTPASCTQDGIITFTCLICGETRTEIQQASGHDYVNGVCTVCGERSTKAPTLDDFTYIFSNSRTSFGYPESYRIPLERYQTMFGNTATAKSLYNRSGSWGGSCFGFSSSSGIFYNNGNALNTTDFRSTAIRPFDLRVNDYASKYAMNVQQLLEAMQISQYSPLIQNDYRGNRDKLSVLCDSVDTMNYAPTLIAVFGPQGGHALLGYKIESINATISYLHVYDCNYPNQDRYITLTKNSAGQYIKWYYQLNNMFDWGTDYGGCWISFVPYEHYNALWTNRGHLGDLTSTLVILNSESAKLMDYDGNILASIKNGQLTTDCDYIYQIHPMGISADGISQDQETAIWMPTDLYTISSDDKSIDELEITIVNMDYSAEVTTTAGSVTFAVDNEEDLNYVQIGEANQDYSLHLYSGTDNAELEITGTTTQEVLALGVISGGYYANGVDVSNILINGGAAEASVSEHIPAAAIRLSVPELTLSVGDTTSIDVIIIPDTTDKCSITWSSSDTSVVSVDKEGNLTALNVGEAQIVAQVDGVCGVCNVRVLENQPASIVTGVCGKEGDNLLWSYNPETGTLTITGSGDMASYDNYNNNAAPWYAYREAIQKVVVADGVSSIGSAAFADCAAIKEVSLPEGLKLIDRFAFELCTSLTHVELPNGNTTIGMYAFEACTALTSVTIPDTMTYIGIGAFHNCTALKSVLIPKSVVIIDNAAFGYYYDANMKAHQVKGFTVYGYRGSAAESYAKTYKFTFVPMDNTVGGFADIREGDWFASAVLWAVSQNPAITNGTDATHFSPNKTCTRAEVVQFLWNAAGKPAPAIDAPNPFVDVDESDWYYNAVLWAVSNGITNGTDETHFAPTKRCTRAEVVMFLWNAAGNPKAESDKSVILSVSEESRDSSSQAPQNDMRGTANPFDDVPNDAWYVNAVLWAVAEGITSGTDATHFAPTKVCTRAEVVQFLYKASV